LVGYCDDAAQRVNLSRCGIRRMFHVKHGDLSRRSESTSAGRGFGGGVLAVPLPRRSRCLSE
jgi:hypothetical protein